MNDDEDLSRSSAAPAGHLRHRCALLSAIERARDITGRA
jgi:hypothetical protein